VWVPLQVMRAGKRVGFAPLAVATDVPSGSDATELARRVRTLTGNYQLIAWMSWLLLPGKNRIWWQFISHKVLRLAAPWLLVGLAASSGAPLLPTATSEGLMYLLIAGQFVFYAAAALGHRAGRIGGAARTFVVLNAAALVGLWGFVSGRQRVTWKITR